MNRTVWALAGAIAAIAPLGAHGSAAWSAALPAGPQATPMVSERDGRSFVVVTAGGASEDGERGDYVIAFTLREAGE